jgi:hypothetical protein
MVSSINYEVDVHMRYRPYGLIAISSRTKRAVSPKWSESARFEIQRRHDKRQLHESRLI